MKKKEFSVVVGDDDNCYGAATEAAKEYKEETGVKVGLDHLVNMFMDGASWKQGVIEDAAKDTLNTYEKWSAAEEDDCDWSDDEDECDECDEDDVDEWSALSDDDEEDDDEYHDRIDDELYSRDNLFDCDCAFCKPTRWSRFCGWAKSVVDRVVSNKVECALLSVVMSMSAFVLSYERFADLSSACWAAVVGEFYLPYYVIKYMIMM